MKFKWFRVHENPKVTSGQVYLGVLALVPADYVSGYPQSPSWELLYGRERVEVGQSVDNTVIRRITLHDWHATTIGPEDQYLLGWLSPAHPRICGQVAGEWAN
jgi:hypothetical protein